MRRRRIRAEDETEINLTPMLDVVFIMLIFFIVTASFVKESGIEVNRPSAASAQPKEQGTIMVALSETGQIWVNKRNVDIRSLRANLERLHAENPNAGVVIQADKHSQTGLLVEVMDSARLAKIENVSIAAEHED